MLRNLGIVAHVNAGKTTLSEQILFLTGKQPYLGDVEAGTATMDWLPQEQERGISISTSMSTVQWGGHRIHLIDTPGHVDFGPEIERALQVIDGVIVVIDGVRGVESQTETVWRYLQKLAVPRLVFVNKLDREVADLGEAIRLLRERLAVPLLPMVHPQPAERRCIDLLADDGARYAEEWGRIQEACADEDASIMADYVAGRQVASSQLLPQLRRGTLECRIVPLFAGSALHGWGVAELLDGVCRYLPAPQDRQRRAAGGELLVPDSNLGRELLALVFKVVFEDGKAIGFLRVFQGVMRQGEAVESSSGQSFDMPELWSMHALHRDVLERAEPGDVLAIELPSGLRAGDSLRTPGCSLEMERVDPSPPVLTIALEPCIEGDRERLQQTVAELMSQDPSLSLEEDAVTGDLLVSGMGELHLEIFADSLRRAMPRPPRIAAPRIREAERPLSTARGIGECQRRVGELCLEARAELVLHPQPGGGAARISLAPTAEPEDLLAGLLAQLAEICAGGLSAGRPLRDARIELVSVGLGEEAGEASRILAQDALRLALQRALKAAGVEVLEPCMQFQLRCPDWSLGSVLADLRSRLAKITEVLPSYGFATVTGEIALAGVLGWSTPLRSMSKGQGEVILAFSHFAAKEHHKKA